MPNRGKRQSRRVIKRQRTVTPQIAQENALAKAERIWGESIAVPWGLFFVAACAGVWSYFHSAPGIAIGLLALIGVVVSLRPQMKFWERMTWIALLSAFALLEITAIEKNDEANKRLIDNVSGGTSYAYVVPLNSRSDAPGISMQIRNGGDSILSEVDVRIARYVSECAGDSKSCIGGTDAGLTVPIKIGTLSPHGQQMMPGFIFPNLGTNGLAHFLVWIYAQNGMVEEELWFRHAKSGQGFAYKLTASRQIAGPSDAPGSTGKFSSVNFAQNIDWTEPNLP